MLERVITAIGQTLARGGRTDVLKRLNTSLVVLFLGSIGMNLAGLPPWIVGMVAVPIPLIVLAILAVYVFGLKTGNFDILRSEFSRVGDPTTIPPNFERNSDGGWITHPTKPRS